MPQGEAEQKKRAVVFYHRTIPETAEEILAGGFRESTGQYRNTVPLSGGWLADVLDPNEGACGDVMLRLTVALNANEVAYYEGKEDGRPYRDRAYILAKNEYRIGTT